MRVALLCLVLAAAATPAYAGHGSIEETDECFIVEYYGDATDKAADSKATSAAQSKAAPEDPAKAAAAKAAKDAADLERATRSKRSRARASRLAGGDQNQQ